MDRESATVRDGSDKGSERGKGEESAFVVHG